MGHCDTSATAAIFALHLYHIAFFRPLPVVDWVHHGVMVLWMLPLAYALAPGHLLAHGAFYASGFPGGIDYLLLVLIKCGVVTPMQEKEWNYYIQSWIRAPGCVIHAALTYVCYIHGRNRVAAGLPMKTEDSTEALIPQDLIYIPALVVGTTFLWNGIYFLNRVTASYAVHSLKRTLAKEGAASTKKIAASEDD